MLVSSPRNYKLEITSGKWIMRNMYIKYYLPLVMPKGKSIEAKPDLELPRHQFFNLSFKTITAHFRSALWVKAKIKHICSGGLTCGQWRINGYFLEESGVFGLGLCRCLGELISWGTAWFTRCYDFSYREILTQISILWSLPGTTTGLNIHWSV